MPIAINGSGSISGVGGQVTPLSSVRVHTANGYGSTNTMIRRFTTVVENVGSDITYADSATLGASFTINTNGVYSITACDSFNAASSVGISKNTAAPSTGIASIAAADRLAVATSALADYVVTCSVTVYLTAGSVIRQHNQGAATGLTPICIFTITRVA